MILMSSLVFIDLAECIERLEKLTESKVVAKKVKAKSLYLIIWKLKLQCYLYT